MNEEIVKYLLKSRLDRLTGEQLGKVSEFVATTFSEDESDRRIIQMEGIWKGLGFEKIVDLEREIKATRAELDSQTLEKSKEWSSS